MVRRQSGGASLQAELTNSPSRTNLALERGQSYSFGLFFQTADDHRIDITGCTITLTATKPPHAGGTPVLSVEALLVDPLFGHAQVDLQPADLDLTPGSYPFDISLVTDTSYSSIVVKGSLTISANTAPVGPTYDVVQPPDSLTLTLRNQSVAVVVNTLGGNQLEVGTVSTVPEGSEAAAWIEGDYPHQLLHLTLPGGGPQGPPGPVEVTQVEFDTEVTDRANADTALGARIDSEVTDRANADTALGARIDSEVTNRANADTALGARIDTEVTDRTNEIARIDYEKSTMESWLNKGVPNGYASLDATAKVPAGQLPATKALVPQVQYFTVGGTWNKPAGLVYAVVEVQGAGGGGGGTGAAASGQNAKGGGGGAGGYTKRVLLASQLGNTETVSVGAYGPGGDSSGSSGSPGGSSYFGTNVGTRLTATGGSGGSGGTSNAASFAIPGGQGGIASGYVEISYPGCPGGFGWGDGVLGVSGEGGASYFGGGGIHVRSGSTAQSLPGNNGRAAGSGGSGALSTSTGAGASGGSGESGIVIVTSYVLTSV